MAAGNTFTPIYNVSQYSGIYSLTIANIPTTYTDLFISMTYSGERDQDVYIRFNGDTSANYGYSYIRANNGASVVSGGNQSQGQAVINLNSGWRGTTTNIWIPNYKNTTKYKNWFAQSTGWEDKTTYNYSQIHGGCYRGLSAITSITFLWSNTKQFSDGAGYGLKFNLYGITEA
jgi:hypothetical protein